MKNCVPLFIFSCVSVLLFTFGAPALSAATPPIGIMPFKGAGKQGEAAGEKVAVRMLVALQKTRRYTLVERAELKKALQEIARSQSGLVRDEDIMKIGKQAGAKYMVLGEIQREGGSVEPVNPVGPVEPVPPLPILKEPSKKSPVTPGFATYSSSFRVVKTETGVIIGAGQATGTLEIVSASLSLQANHALAIYLLMDNPESPYSILMKLNKGKNPQYRVDETISLKFKVLKHRKEAPDTVYIRIYSIDARGAMTLIYPNKFSPSRAIQVKKEYALPADEDDFEWVLAKPVGAESIQAIVTDKPLDFFNVKKRYLKGFPTVSKRGGNNPRIYKGIHVRIKKDKIKDWSAERITYTLEE